MNALIGLHLRDLPTSNSAHEGRIQSTEIHSVFTITASLKQSNSATHNGNARAYSALGINGRQLLQVFLFL